MYIYVIEGIDKTRRCSCKTWDLDNPSKLVSHTHTYIYMHLRGAKVDR